MKAYEMIIEAGNHVYKCTRPAKDLITLKYMYNGNGEFVRIKDVTEDTPISLDDLRETLEKGMWGKIETELIISLIQQNYDNAN